MDTKKKESFRLYIIFLFQQANINQKHIDIILSVENISKIENALSYIFVSDTSDEADEFFGNVLVDQFVCFYIRERFSHISNVKILAQLKQNLLSDVLTKFFYDNNLNQYLCIEHFKGNKNVDISGKVIRVLCGSLAQVIISSGFLKGVAIEIINNILKRFFDRVEISTRYEDVFDPVTRLKELYDSLGWSFKNNFISRIGSGNNQTWLDVFVFGWPDVSGKLTKRNRILLTNHIGRPFNKKELEKSAAESTLFILNSNYNIRERVIPNNKGIGEIKYVEKIPRSNDTFNNHQEFIEFLYEFREMKWDEDLGRYITYKKVDGVREMKWDDKNAKFITYKKYK